MYNPMADQQFKVAKQEQRNEKFRQYLQHNQDSPNLNRENRISFISKETPLENESDNYIDEPDKV